MPDNKKRIFVNFSRKNHNNDTVMAFFDEFIQFSSKIRTAYSRSRNRYVAVSVKDEMPEKLDLYEGSIAETLIVLFLRFCAQKETTDICITSEKLDQQKCETVSLIYHKPLRKFSIANNVQGNIEFLREADNNLQKTFIENEIKKRISDKIHALQEVYTRHANVESLWNRKEIFEYLNLYYGTLREFISDENILLTDGIAEGVLLPVLNLGLCKNSDKGRISVDMTAPVVLSALNLIYDRIDDYIRKPIYYLRDEDDAERLLQTLQLTIEQNIFIHKIHQIFRYYILPQKGGELWHAALPAYVPADQAAGEVLNIPVRAMSSYNSYQGIRELRIGDKILYELKQHIGEKAKKKYTITIVGECAPEPLEELIKYVSTSIQYKEDYYALKEIDIYFEVYTLRDAGKSGEIGRHYKYRFIKYKNMLMDVSQLKNILEKGDVLFLLDNCQLYDMDVEEIGDRIIFNQSIFAESYEEFYKRSQYQDLQLECKFFDLYNVLTAYCWKGKLGFLKKNAKENLVKYLRDYIGISESKTLYMYVSDIGAFKKLSCIQEQFVRVEKYNQKEIGIIRFTTHQREKLNVKAEIARQTGRRILVFNMWQVVKHLMIDEWAQIEQFYIKCGEKHFLDEIFIGIDYTDWKQNVKISYQCGKNAENADVFNEANVRKSIRLLFDMLTGGKEADMYQKYLNKTFASFLYGSAQSVEDLIFLHIFKTQARSLNFCFMDNEDRGLYKHYNLNCKYSHKKNYWEAIEKFDMDSVSYIEKYHIIESVKGSGIFSDIKKAEQEFLDSIITACENISYTESRLYRKCLEL